MEKSVVNSYKYFKMFEVKEKSLFNNTYICMRKTTMQSGIIRNEIGIIYRT